MRFASLGFAALLAISANSMVHAPALAEGANEAIADPPSNVSVERTPNAPPGGKTVYLIELVEFRLPGVPVAGITAADILARLDGAGGDDGAEVIQTFHLSALAGQESTARVGLMTSVVMGVAYQQGRGVQVPPVRNMSQMSLGTTLTVIAGPDGDEVALKLNYSSSRILGDAPEDSPPDIVDTTVEMPLRVSLGKRVLAGGGSGKQASYIAVTVTEREPNR